jgi:hypothetical protein
MATSHKYKQTSKVWTYGAELELIDWPRNDKLPKGMAIDDGNYTSVNNNGVAADGKGKSYHLGGEILTHPSEDPEDQAVQYLDLKERFPGITHNYRTGLNVHVRVPGLQEDLPKLKQLQKFVHKVMPTLLPIIDPIPEPTSAEYFDAINYAGAKRTHRTRLKDHHTLLTPERLELQMKARTPKEFFEAEAVHLETGKIHWALHARTCVNLRQMLQTDTIEFRHFFMPFRAKGLLNTVLWCKLFLEAAFNEPDSGATELLYAFGGGCTDDPGVFAHEDVWPAALPYDPWLDKGWHFTSPHEWDREELPARISRWLSDNKEEIRCRQR